MSQATGLPPGWDEERVQGVIRHYDALTEEQEVAEDEAAFEDKAQTVVRPYEKRRRTRRPKVEALTHTGDARVNIPTAELASVMPDADREEIRVAYERYYGNGERVPQLIWRGKDEQDWTDLVTVAPPLFVEEKVHPKALVDDLMRLSAASREEAEEYQTEMAALFDDFNGLPEGADRTEFYRHDVNWNNRMVLGDSLRVMASLAEREGLRGKVQCIYLDPPYGIRFNSNFQWSTTSRDVRDGNVNHITREPEQVRAFRDTWRDGVHSYLSYLRDRFTVARDLLADSGSIFVQIGDENVHRVRTVMDEVFGEDNFVVTLKFSKTAGLGGRLLDETFDYLLWFGKKRSEIKFRRPYLEREVGGVGATQYNLVMSELGEHKRINDITEIGDGRLFSHDNLTSQTGNNTTIFEFELNGQTIKAPQKGGWKSNRNGIERLKKANRLISFGETPRYVRYFDDASFYPLGDSWLDTRISGFGDEKLYVVQTLPKVIQRCILMTTDPGDLVLDPTCGSGTTAYVAEQWGRRWITIDTSRVALALARSRIMGARYPYYLLADSREGQLKEAEVARRVPSDSPTYGDVRQGFVYERVPHIQLRDIANNAEIDVIWETYQEELDPLRERLNAALGESWEEWEIPREVEDEWPEAACEAHAAWWERRIARQREIDASIAAGASVEYLYDKPYTDNRRVRVAGPFTVESLSPHRAPLVDEDELREPQDGFEARETGPGVRYQGPAPQRDFAADMLEQLRQAGVQQAHKEDRIAFTSVNGWPGKGYVCAEGRFTEGETERRAGIFIGPEFGTVSRADLTAAAREAADTGFDLLIACAFSYDAHTNDMESLGRVRILKARMNADLHMATDLKATERGNLFVIFGEPDVQVEEAEDDMFHVRVLGVDVYDPRTGEVRSDDPDGIACWFLDTDYNEESFFVRHAYFLGANDPYKSLKTTLKTEINREAWESLHSAVSRPFPRPASGRIAVKVYQPPWRRGDEGAVGRWKRGIRDTRPFRRRPLRAYAGCMTIALTAPIDRACSSRPRLSTGPMAPGDKLVNSLDTLFSFHGKQAMALRRATQGGQGGQMECPVYS